MDPLWTATERGFNRQVREHLASCRPATPLGRLAHLPRIPSRRGARRFAGSHRGRLGPTTGQALPSSRAFASAQALGSARYAGAIAACLLFFVTAGSSLTWGGSKPVRSRPLGRGDPSPWWSAVGSRQHGPGRGDAGPGQPRGDACRGVVPELMSAEQRVDERCLCCTAGPADWADRRIRSCRTWK